ncbi:MAG TPA: zinc ABC transporter substrate-binding protein [Kiritimatiellia bacterium]|nr:zinc ABC transporter substrate-binding protein [Kiritimatiellia bacterium]
MKGFLSLMLVGMVGVMAGPVPVLGERPIRVVATVGMIGDLVEQVAGDRAEVVTLIGAGMDPHSYKVTRRDVARLSEADVVFYNGLLLEGRMGDVLARIGRSGKPVIAVAERLDASLRLEDPEAKGKDDPHLWMDVGLWSGALEVIAEALGAFDPVDAERYRARAREARATLLELDEAVRRAMQTIPEARRVLVTAHDAFQYFGRAYGMEVMGIQGISTESEAGLRDINRLVGVLVERGIGAVFVETSVADKNVRALVEGARARGHTVKIGGELFSDAMGLPGTYEGTYVGMMDHNATTVTRALGGTVGESGWVFKGTDGGSR